MPIELGGVDLAPRNAGATKSLPILLEHGEHRMGEHASALFDQHVIITDTVESVQETGKRGAGFSRTARAGDQGTVSAKPERGRMGETHIGRRIGPMQEQAEWRAGFPWRDIHRARKRHHAVGGGPIVELPGRRIMMIEAAQIARVENPIEIARCKSRHPRAIAPAVPIPPIRRQSRKPRCWPPTDRHACAGSAFYAHRSASASLENQIVMSSFAIRKSRRRRRSFGYAIAASSRFLA